ncbi:uncharacterized protein E0L32_000299 [Thyridium curvatum]|uniref:Uncharacterized protein n=1 Tax=Thyridium curvatum TaxID=1093900 RepID=A0A507AYS0_9PEZI|nr:uncharacterized protein E0L32_000299 [Thyridium curvatum]TPX15965.1 hypothetical protein E0L32_000299 [Thyridium curvatum]
MTFTVTDAPRFINTQLTSTETLQSLQTSTVGSNGAGGANGNGGGDGRTNNRNGFLTTTVPGGIYATTTTFTIDPTGTSPGTIIVVTPGAINGPAQTNGLTFETITEEGPAGSAPTSVTIFPSGTNTQGLVIVATPPPALRRLFRTITVQGPPGSQPTQYTILPTGNEIIGTVVVQTPGAQRFTGPYTTITRGYDGAATETITLQPQAGGTQGTVVVETPIRTAPAGGAGGGGNGAGAGGTGGGTGTGGTGGGNGGTGAGGGTGGTGGNTGGTGGGGTGGGGTGSGGTGGGGTGGGGTSGGGTGGGGTGGGNGGTGGGNGGSCVPTTPSGAPYCTVALPPACRNLGNSPLVPTVVDIAACTVALGGAAVGNVLNCLVPSLTGPSIVSCLNNALVGTPCITNLPQRCLNLNADVSAGSALNADVAACADALGPYSGSPAVQLCLNTNVNTNGLAIINCLQNAYGFPVATPQAPAGCTNTPTQACPQLPPDCAALATVDVTTARLKVPLCQNELGLLASVGDTATCLVNNVIGALAPANAGQTLYNCLNQAIGPCITTLPQPCNVLSATAGTAAAAQVQLCSNALQLFNQNGAQSCLADPASTGAAIVACLNLRLFGITANPAATVG